MSEPPRSRESLLRSDGPGSSLIRKLFPTAGVVVVGLAFLRWQGEQQGLYGNTVGIVLMTAASLAVIGGLLWFFASGLNRGEAERVEAEEALRRTSRYFELSP